MRISFIGAGAITEALLTGLIYQEVVKREHVAITNHSNQKRLQVLTHKYGLRDIHEQQETLLEADVIVLAVKPQVASLMLSNWGARFTRQHLLLSVIAGVTTAHIEKYIAEDISVIRSMPNTSSTIGMSATAIAAGKNATKQEMKLAEEIFNAIGTVVALEEYLMDAVTGLSGSGPAYFYYMVEGLELAGREVGLPREVSRQLILQTLIGAAHMLLETKKNPEVLREEITSEGGTTAAGLQVMRDYRFIEGLEKVITAATARSKEMGTWNEGINVTNK
jgi:pyrroline-5-carboxylate reductase